MYNRLNKLYTNKKNAIPTLNYITYNEYYLGLMLDEARQEPAPQHSNTIHRLKTHIELRNNKLFGS